MVVLPDTKPTVNAVLPSELIWLPCFLISCPSSGYLVTIASAALGVSMPGPARGSCVHSRFLRTLSHLPTFGRDCWKLMPLPLHFLLWADGLPGPVLCSSVLCLPDSKPSPFYYVVLFLGAVQACLQSSTLLVCLFSKVIRETQSLPRLVDSVSDVIRDFCPTRSWFSLSVSQT